MSSVPRMAVLVVLGLLVAVPMPAPGGAVEAPDPGEPSVGLPLDLVLRTDPDGGRSLLTLVEDDPAGPYAYTRADLSNVHDTLGALVGQVDPALGDQVAATDEPVQEAGAYTHAWTLRGSPMVTVGLYAVNPDEGLLRMPLVVLENVTATSELADLVVALLLDEGTDLAGHALPFLAEWALPELGPSFDTWPNGNATVDSYQDQPRIYAWTVRRSTPAAAVSLGAYVERLGHHEGGFDESEAFEGTHSVEIGAALRVDGTTTRLAGAYVESELDKQPGESWRAHQRLTVGVASETTGRVPLAAIDLEDERDGAALVTYPDHQRSGLAVGVFVDGTWTPLVGTWTEAEHRILDDENVEQWRTTSIGPYVDGAYVPAAGFRYHGERTPLGDWAGRFLAGGGPGAQTMGGWEVDLGTFHDGAFVPLAGATYATDLPRSRFAYASMLTAGVHVGDTYQPLVGVTYDGKQPLLPWLTAWASGDPDGTADDWIVSTGTFAGPAYLPLVGISYHDRAPGGARAHQDHVTVGTFAGEYRSYVPVAALSYDGDVTVLAWTQGTALGGGPGADVGEWDATVGAYVLGGHQGLVGAQHRTHEGPYTARTSVGAYDATGTFTPLFSVTYEGNGSLAENLGTFANPGDDGPVRFTAGPHVAGSYVPVVAVEHDGERTTVALVPPR